MPKGGPEKRNRNEPRRRNRLGSDERSAQALFGAGRLMPARPPAGGNDGVPGPTIVAVGASAGGLEAFMSFLEGLPEDTGMAFVLVQHLAANRKSTLARLLSSATSMAVVEAADGMIVEPNQVYVMPPHRDIVLERGAIKHLSRPAKSAPHMPVDNFMRSLAAANGKRSVGIVLSGSATDGSLGVRAIREAGGATFAQEPHSARFESMPQSAIDTGCVDHVVPAEEMGGLLRELPADLGGDSALQAPVAEPNVATEPAASLEPDEATEANEPIVDEAALLRIIAALKLESGTDFATYRRTTICRRIDRRMAIQRCERLSDYARFLEDHPAEVEALRMDVLISVTSFFRDPEVFETLAREVLPVIVRERRGQTPIRIWVAGCATGEEAYSIGICLAECMGEPGPIPLVQIFATDVSERAVETARAGLYPQAIASNVSPERLKRFFRRSGAGYQVSEALRDMCVFAVHDVTRDPPFSRLDLVSCRNTLIYLQPPMQKKLLATFHYALLPQRFLLVGLAETVAPNFDPVHREHRIFVRREIELERSAMVKPAPRARADGRAAASRSVVTADSRRIALLECERILQDRFLPASVLVDERLRVLHFWGHTEPFLEHRHGEASLDLTRLVRTSLRAGLQAALERAALARGPRIRTGSRADRRTDGSGIEVIPISTMESGSRHSLIVFEAGPRGGEATRRSGGGSSQADATSRRLARLEHELAAVGSERAALAEAQEAAVEELQSANEEILCSNEELQSVNEAMETVKDQLQEGNAKLTELNEALNRRNDELIALGDDLGNLVTALDIPILMLSRDLRLRRVTPAATTLLGLGPKDIGHRLADLDHAFHASDVVRQIEGAIATRTVVDREIEKRDGRFYNLRVRPFVTKDGVIDGAVVILIDIDDLKRATVLVEQARDFADAIVDAARSSLLILDSKLRIERANQSFYETFRVKPEDTLGRHICDIGSGQWNVPELRKQLEAALTETTSFDGVVVAAVFPTIGPKTMILNGRRLRQVHPGDDKILLAVEDLNAARTGEDARAAMLAEARWNAELHAGRLKDEFVATVSHELRGPLNAIAGWTHVLQAGETDSDTFARGLGAIDRSVKAQTVLIDDLLDMARIVAGNLRLAPQLVDFVPIATSAVENMSPAANAKGQSVTVSSEVPKAFVLGDPERLHQIVWNLVSNAVKFTPRGGRIEVSIRKSPTLWELRVVDNGQGIDAQFLPHIFDRFRQADPTSRRRHSGLGIGLAIARHLVELHGGVIGVESDGIGKGATFTVGLPIPPVLPQVIAPATSAPARRAVSEQVNTAPLVQALRDLHVLVVDDDADSRDMLKTVLEAYGAAVESAGSADEALRALDSKLPDVLLSDIGMPERDGIDLIRLVRIRPADRGGKLPAAALTAFVAPGDRDRALSAGFQVLLTKPVSPPELVRVLGDLVRAARGL